MYTDQFEGKAKWRNISLEEFDTMTGDHKFSKKYEERKQKLLEGLQEKELKRPIWMHRVAVAAVIAMLVIPATVYAAVTHGEFFDGLFGNVTKKSVDVVETDIDGNKVTLPAKEYVPVDQEKAEDMIGSHVSDQSIVRQIGDHTLTITSVVYDRHAAQVAFTLERKGGVTMLTSHEAVYHTGEVSIAEESEYLFYFGMGREDGGFLPAGSNFYVDADKSTEDKVYCYAYICEPRGFSAPALQILKRHQYDGSEVISLTDEAPVESVEYTADSGDYMELSAISLFVNLENQVTQVEEDGVQALLMAEPEKVEICYLDGSSYVVINDEENIDNSGYICGSGGSDHAIAFNRLVNVDQVESVVVNGEDFHIATH